MAIPNIDAEALLFFGVAEVAEPGEGVWRKYGEIGNPVLRNMAETSFNLFSCPITWNRELKGYSLPEKYAQLVQHVQEFELLRPAAHLTPTRT
jgi:hypothetical protein